MEGRPVIAPTLIIAAVLVQAVTLFAWAKPGKPEKPGKPAKEQVTVEAKKIKAPKKAGRPDREFPIMFDIAVKARSKKPPKK